MRAVLLFVTLSVCYAAAPEPGLLFYLSGDRGFTADYAAGGNPEPNYLRDVKIIAGGARGPGFQCAGTQLMAYWAPGNIYAERGTLAFHWRSREPVGPTPFPVFRVGYADHSSWDMVWLRIDYNGRGGFDGFVTDINLSRIRVSYVMPSFPKPDQWVHLALSWDETRGIRFYVNGALAAQKDAQAVLYAGLDQFGPHSRIISPYQVQSAYNFIRGGDIDEIRIYDRMLSDANVASLANGIAPQGIPAITRDPEEWYLRYGWNRQGDVPPYLSEKQTRVRKVEIQDVYDLKRWWWKGTDGIRETTWPGVYNRSRLPGRNDYFQLPDWDCYSLSGKSVTFTMPDEPWNQLEISGSAWGKMFLEGAGAKVLFERPRGQEKTFHRLAAPLRGQKIHFENVEQEEPIGELSAYYVSPGGEPKGSARLAYILTATAEPASASLAPLMAFIHGRYTEDERSLMVALPAGARRQPRKTAPGLPLVHILIPAEAWQSVRDGLDGIALDLPALRVKPTHRAYFPLNVRVKDPLWPNRDMLDFSFSVKPGEARTLWLDTRDRILPPGKGLYLTIAGAGADFGPASLEGTEVRLIFKPRAGALKEHELDRFTQVRDNYAMMVEEHPASPKLNLYNRFMADIGDLLQVNPNHRLGQLYWYDIDKSHPKPAFQQPEPPAGVPLWAFRQVEQLRYLKRFVLWYIDHRQIDNGEFGGGLSDDADFTNWFPGTALMGSEPEKIQASLLREMEAFYREGMFTNGLSTIQADELHSYEEGIDALGQSMLLDFGSPKLLERAMETSRALIDITGVNSPGHRHIRSSYFSGTRMAEEDPWGWSKPSSYLILHPALMLVEYNGSPEIRKVMLELADGLLAHRKKDDRGRYQLFSTIKFQTDEDMAPSLTPSMSNLLWAAWRWSGDAKYLEPFRDAGPGILDSLTVNAIDPLGVTWQGAGDTRYLETLYARQIEASALREYINTEGSLWIDRVTVPNAELQRARLGGVAIVRNGFYPGHAVSWKFHSPANDESAAILIPRATPDAVQIIVYNLNQTPIKATMTAWGLAPGRWTIVQSNTSSQTVDLERSRGVDFEFPPHVETTLDLKLVEPGTPYWARPDLGIGQDDVVVQGNTAKVTVHSLGGVDAPASTVALCDPAGKVVVSASVPPLPAPSDLRPKTAKVTLTAPPGTRLSGYSVVLDPAGRLHEITRLNNQIQKPVSLN